MVNGNDLVPNLLRGDSGLSRATQGYLGQTILNKISKHVLEDDDLVELIGKSNELLQSIINKYSQKKEKLINDEIQSEITALVFNSNYTEDRFKLQTFVNKIDVMIVKVATQKNELASYRNELKEVIKLTTPNQTNGQRLIDLAGIVQYLDFKILKIENDIESAKNQIISLNKCFDVTFFHLQESIDKQTSENLYLDVMFKLSQLKLRNYQAKTGLVIAGSISMIVAIYHLIASQITWKSEIVENIGYIGGMGSSIISSIFTVGGILFFGMAIFNLYTSMRDNNGGIDLSSITTTCAMLGIGFVSSLFSMFLSDGATETKVVGYATYQLLNIGVVGGLLHLILGVILVAWGIKKNGNIKILSEKQNQIYKLCKGK